jgi:hypothetical protein
VYSRTPELLDECPVMARNRAVAPNRAIWDCD